MGRPSKHTKALVDEICERLSKGEPLAQICRDDHMPVRGTVRNWRNENAEVNDRIARAREDGEHAIAADCLNIADDNGSDMRIIADGVQVVDHDVIQRAKLRIETRLKLLAKWNPKKWGDKVDLTSGGAPLPAPTILLAHAQPERQAD